MLPQHASQELKQKGKSAPGYTLTKSDPGVFGQAVLSAYTVGRVKEALSMFPARLISRLGSLLSLECAGGRLIVRKQPPFGWLEQSTMGGFVPKLILTHNLAPSQVFQLVGWNS